MDPPFCANGCGFFGSHDTNNMCSKCYKEQLLKLNQQIYESIDNITIPSSSSHNQDLCAADEHKKNESSLISEVSASKSDDEPREKKRCKKDESPLISEVSASKSDDEPREKKRCKSCNKKVGLTGFMCQCGNLFCGKHRYPEEHSCTVDYKHHGRELLQKQNPLIKSDKL